MKRFLIASYLPVVLSAPVKATPTQAVPAPPNPTPSVVLGDTRDATQLWVLPPIAGKAGIPQLSLETPEATCEGLKDLVNASASLNKQVAALIEQRGRLLARISEEKNADEVLSLQKKTALLLQDIITESKVLKDIYGDDARLHGGTLAIPFVHEIERHVASIKAANPAKTVKDVQTFNVRFFFVPEGAGELARLPIISSYKVNGVAPADYERTRAPLAARLSATVGLTRIGACMMGFPQKFGARPSTPFGMIATYEYPYAFKSSIRASYNIKNIYSFLKSSGTSGGLFNSSSWSKTLESNWGETALKFHWETEDPESKLSPADRLETEKLVKAHLLASMDKLLLQKADLKPAEAANPGPHGATVLADGIEKTCATNGYCAAASIALRTLDAIFGSSEMSTEVQKRLDVTATFFSNETTSRYVTQGVVYAAE